MRVAVLEDEQITAQLIQHWLEDAGYECKIFHDGTTFKRKVVGDSFDLFILLAVTGYQWGQFKHTDGGYPCQRIRNKLGL